MRKQRSDSALWQFPHGSWKLLLFYGSSSLHGEENTPKPLMQYLKVRFFLAVLNCSLNALTTSFGDAYMALTREQGWMQRKILPASDVVLN